jgi:hypothetical protein
MSLFNNLKLELFIKIIMEHNNVNDILTKCNTQSEKGCVYERLWDIIIKFGFSTEFPNSKYCHLIGNSNNGNLQKLDSLTSYLKNNIVNSGNSGGYFDITLFDPINNKYIFIACHVNILNLQLIEQNKKVLIIMMCKKL